MRLVEFLFCALVGSNGLVIIFEYEHQSIQAISRYLANNICNKQKQPRRMISVNSIQSIDSFPTKMYQQQENVLLIHENPLENGSTVSTTTDSTKIENLYSLSSRSVSWHVSRPLLHIFTEIRHNDPKKTKNFSLQGKFFIHLQFQSRKVIRFHARTN